MADTLRLNRKGSAMPRTRAPYPPEYREQIVELDRNGRSMAELAREFEPCYATIGPAPLKLYHMKVEPVLAWTAPL